MLGVSDIVHGKGSLSHTFSPTTLGMQNERHGQILVYPFLGGNGPMAHLVPV